MSENSMPVMMVQIRIVHKSVPNGFVPVPMRTRFWDWSVMRMLVMLVMHVDVHVFLRHMLMLVIMTFAQVQPKPKPHQQCCDNKFGRKRFSENCHRNQGPDERSK